MTLEGSSKYSISLSLCSVDAVQTFLKKNKLSGIIRAHEAQSQGYKMAMKHPKTEIPRVITIFSAPNYCDVRAVLCVAACPLVAAHCPRLPNYVAVTSDAHHVCTSLPRAL